MPRSAVVRTGIPNSDFEFAPTFVAAQTINGWINGTSSGGGTRGNTFKWAKIIGVGSSTCQFDSSTSHSGTYSLKVSTTAVNSRGIVSNANTTSGVPVIDTHLAVFPSILYVISFWMKVAVVSGAGSEGGFLRIIEKDSSGTTVVTTDSTKINATVDWTQYTVSFTTSSTTGFLELQLIASGQTGTATLIFDVWFDDIIITREVRTLV